MLIGELSRRTGVNTHQLRYYEAQRLIGPGRRSNGYREYASGDVVTVTQIRRLLEAGLSTQEIRFLLPCASGAVPDLEPCPELLATLRDRVQRLEEHMNALSRNRRTLLDLIEATEQRAPEPDEKCASVT